MRAARLRYIVQPPCAVSVKYLPGKLRSLLLAILPGLHVLCGPAVAENTNVLRQAERLLNQGHPVQAAALLEDYRGKLVGQREFAYLYGLALFESGKAERAIPYLEEATASDPLFAGARIELARAYYQAARYEEAQKQFEYLSAQNPPAVARRAIDEYLAAIDQKLLQFRWRNTWLAEPRLGYDSNANAATELNDFLGFTLDTRSREAESSFVDLRGRADFSRLLRGGRLLELGAETQARAYPDASFVNSIGLVGRAGMKWAEDGETRSLNLRTYRLHVDGDFNNHGLSLEGSWDRSLDNMTRTGVFSRVGVLRFDDAFSNRDVNQLLVGVSGTRVLGQPRRGLLTLSAIVGLDDPLESSSRYGRDLFGARAYAASRFGQAVTGRLSAGWQRSNYDQAFFEAVDTSRRRDTLTDVSASVAWRMDRRLEVSTGLGYSHNDSSVDLFSYDRWLIYLSVTRTW